MATNYRQTDTAATFNVGCSGQTAGVTTDGRLCTFGGILGSAGVLGDPGNLVTRACTIFALTPPNLPAWPAGTAVVRINHSAMDGGTILTNVDICDWDGSTTYTSIGGNSSPGHTRGATGVLTVNVTVSARTVTSRANSRYFIILTYNNSDSHGASSYTITPNQLITTTYTILQPASMVKTPTAHIRM